MPSGQPTLYIAQADVLRAERVLRAVERALARAVEYQETTGAEHETPEAEAEAEGVVRAARAGFEERWARSSGYNRLQAELELAREQLLAARHRLNAMTSGHQPPRGGPGEPVSTEPVAVRTTAVRASPRVPVADEPRPDGLGESAAEPPGENLDVVPSGLPSGDEDSVEEPRAAVPQQAAGSDGRPALLLARTPRRTADRGTRLPGLSQGRACRGPDPSSAVRRKVPGPRERRPTASRASAAC